MPRTEWDDVECAILAALCEPVTCEQAAERTGLSRDLTSTQLKVLRGDGLVTEVMDVGVRYRLTPTGRARLSQLADRPGRPAAA